MISKNVLPNLIAAALVAISFLFPAPYQAVILSTGLFALSGALTNWLAVHMLFEKIPGLYGSGVIVTHFEQFKTGIVKMVHEQLFSQDKVQKVLGDESSAPIDLAPVIEHLDLDAAYNELVSTVMESSLGGMLGMFGGESALDALRDPFKLRMKTFLQDATASPRMQKAIQAQLQSMTSSDQFLEKLDAILRERLDELTPEMVRDIMQVMIRKHLGWLVVWGGVFGGLIGLVAGIAQAV